MTDARRNVYIPDEDWTRLQRLAAALGAKEGKSVSMSETIRRAVATLAKRMKV